MLFLVIAGVYLLPAALAALLWWSGDHPSSWRQADWSSARILPAPQEQPDAALYIFAARTGGMKGAVSEHSWIVVKDRDAGAYERWDKVGWGMPIRQNHRAADGLWYSNVPKIIVGVTGADAERLIPQVRAAIADYPFAEAGGYTMFPGPNSNSFVAHVMRAVPGIDASLPVAAVGRDYPSDGRLVAFDPDRREVRLSLWGYAGLVVGWQSGLEINLLGLVAGLDPRHLAVKVPAFGTYSLLGA
ncbi:DUF3750 domain-containing protein [Aurantimonas aggregata]|uniref:DUF3750 domain-containing protein n=1 Tax=Aurantimonas aggregata TaxID=2047720 RepID=A0A6L9MDD4_9HYPH|nr:DUF3750 domain-containing protein [Aurantimonas aggregata]NDV85819.1 DUF3750 domain-containing protein [Aurantimonas aggregata]